MDEMEFNKIFAAILIAGILAMFTGFLSEKIVHEDKLKEDAYAIEALEGPVAAVAQKDAGPEPILAMIASASVEKGQGLSKACAACHSFDKGGANRVGPNLYDVVNRKIGGVDGFAYSSTLADDNEGWTYQNLNAFLWKPKKTYPGTKMNYIGLKKPSDRAAMVAWLRTLADSPAPLPSAAQIAAEAPKEDSETSDGTE